MTGDMTPSWLVWVFNSYASLAILFIILVLFCFVFEHETIYTALVLAVFDFYYRTYACNLTECENLQNSDCPFSLLFEDFCLCSRYNNVNYGAWHVCKTFVWFFWCYLPTWLFRNFTFQKTWRKVPDIVRFGRWRDSLSSALCSIYTYIILFWICDSLPVCLLQWLV